MQSKEEIFKWIGEIFAREFGFSPDELRLETHLIDDLDMDSIDAIDMAVRIEEAARNTHQPIVTLRQ